jgi:hypothetical protein
VVSTFFVASGFHLNGPDKIILCALPFTTISFPKLPTSPLSSTPYGLATVQMVAFTDEVVMRGKAHKAVLFLFTFLKPFHKKKKCAT